MATLSSVLAWRIPWTEESDRLQSMGSHVTNAFNFLSLWDWQIGETTYSPYSGCWTQASSWQLPNLWQSGHSRRWPPFPLSGSLSTCRGGQPSHGLPLLRPQDGWGGAIRTKVDSSLGWGGGHELLESWMLLTSKEAQSCARAQPGPVPAFLVQFLWCYSLLTSHLHLPSAWNSSARAIFLKLLLWLPFLLGSLPKHSFNTKALLYLSILFLFVCFFIPEPFFKPYYVPGSLPTICLYLVSWATRYPSRIAFRGH